MLQWTNYLLIPIFLNFVWTLRFRFILRRVRKTVTCCLLPTFLLQL